MKIYKLTCQKCEVARVVDRAQYHRVMSGKGTSQCRKCSDNVPPMEYRVTCPLCSKERLVGQTTYSNVKYGRIKGLCSDCSEYYAKFGNKEPIITPQVLANEAAVKICKEQKAINDAVYRSRHKDKCAEKSRRYRLNNIEAVRLTQRIANFKRRAFSYIHKNIIEQIIEEQTINGMIFCYICRQECSDNYHIDHVVPIVKGGRNNKENLKLACSFCNLRKNAKDLDEFLDRNPYLKALHMKEEA